MNAQNHDATKDLTDEDSSFKSLDKRTYIIFLIIFTEVLGFTLISPILPYLGLSLNLNELEIGLVNSIFSFCQLFSSPIIGKLSDRYGRKPMLLISQLSTLGGFILLGFATNVTILIMARILDGLFGSNMTVSQACLSDLTTPSQRTTVYSYSSGVFGAGLIFGPLLGGLLSRNSFALPMFVAAGISFISILLVIFFLPETNSNLDNKLKLEIGEIIPVKDMRRFIRNPKISKIILLGALYNFAFMLFISNFTLFTENQLHINAELAGYYRTWIGILRVILQTFIVAKIIQKWNEDRVLKSGILALIFSMIGLTFSWNYWFVYLPLVFLAYGTGVCRPIITSKLTKSVTSTEFATILGVNNAITSISQIITPIIGGLILLYLPSQVLPATAALFFILNYIVSRKVSQLNLESSKSPIIEDTIDSAAILSFENLEE